MTIDKKFWTETEKLMEFARENGRDVVERIYEYRGQQYPVWEQILNARQRNVWLITTEDLRDEKSHPNRTPSKPDLRVNGQGYYIFGFIYDISQRGNGRSRVELQRYLAQQANRQDEWTVRDWSGNPVQQVSPSSTQNKPATKQAVAKSSPRKSEVTAQPAGEKAIDPDLETCRKIIEDNFEQLKKEYREKYHEEFLKSRDVEMFFRRVDLDKIREWNENASSKDDLIDLCAFYELSLGNPSNADVVILGNNPGAKGVFERIRSFENIFIQMEDRKKNRNVFYPMISVDAMKHLPWFPNRLIYGVGGSSWTKREKKDGILYPFLQNGDLNSLCQYAERIATVELVPYHTKTFAAGERFLNEFDLFDPTPVIQAMKNNAVIIALFRNAAERWCDKWREYRKMHPEVLDLERYSLFYVNHKKEENSRAEANASLSKQSLRRYSEFRDSIDNIRENYPDYDAYSEITDYLTKKWEGKKQ